MRLNSKSIEKLRIIINEDSEYRSGSVLVKFFNELGFRDIYMQGFPSRWAYTEENLKKINGTSVMDQCIKKTFAPINFVNELDRLDDLITEFNNYLSFDGWLVVRNNREITFKRTNTIDWIENKDSSTDDEKSFLQLKIESLPVDKLGLISQVEKIIHLRLNEIDKCLENEAPLSAIFLAGSIFEGILLGVATQKPKEYNSAKSSPKNREGKVKQFHDWTLNDFINVSHEIGFLKEDVKKFSVVLRDFRNYIHPYQQLSSNFNPSIHSAELCVQALRVAIIQLVEIIAND